LARRAAPESLTEKGAASRKGRGPQKDWFASRRLDDHVLEVFQRTHFHDVARGLGCHIHHLTRLKRVRTSGGLGGRLTLNDDLAKSRNRKLTRSVLAHSIPNLTTQRLEHSADVLAGEASGFCDVVKDLCLGCWFIIGLN
jgi:hypothetical protein